ncbi:MAG: hypothetical protein KIT25_17075 [Enhydrobacter sp.]|nr:MAG: hypothetical protein KIT25_17075 [Enhydrobacter sp.]
MTKTISRRACLRCTGAAAVLLGNACAGHAVPHGPFCRYSLREGWSHSPASGYTLLRVAGPDDPSGVPQATRRIVRALSFADSFEIRITEGQDNASTTIENGRRIMTIDVGFLQNVNRWASTKWAAIQVLAHEVGHHLGRWDDPHQSELDADYWSGRALGALGAARPAASASILAIGTEFDTRSHPNKFARARAIERGWDDAAG